MNPFQHGEVFVTDDGAETDLDIGHYERFLDVNLVGSANVTTGQVYNHVIAKERRASTSVTPSRSSRTSPTRSSPACAPSPPEVRTLRTSSSPRSAAPSATSSRCPSSRRRARCATSSAATTASSSMSRSCPTSRRAASSRRSRPSTPSPRCARSASSPTGSCCGPTATSPTRSSARSRSCATSTSPRSPPASTRRASTTSHRCCTARGSTRTSSGVSAWASATVDWTEWDQLLERVHDPEHAIEIALVGKYIDLPDAYLSVTEALRAGVSTTTREGLHPLGRQRRVPDPAGAQRALGGVDAILVPGGFGVRGIEGKLGALTWAREKQVPTLASASGCSAWSSSTPARSSATRMRARRSSTPRRRPPGHRDHGGAEGVRRGRRRPRWHAMRLGSYPAALKEGSVTRAAYGQAEVKERHRHRYEVNNSYRDDLEKAGLVFSGTSPDGLLVEFVELPREVHPLLRVDAGAPRVPVAPQPSLQPALRGSRRGGPRASRSERSWRSSATAPLPTRAGRSATRTSTPRCPRRAPPRTPAEPPVSLDAPSGTGADLVEEWTAEPVLESTTPFQGIIFDVVRERVDLGAGGVVTRDFVTHPGPSPCSPCVSGAASTRCS